MKATITERGQISIPAALRREMRLEAGQTVVWERVSDSEFRVTVLPMPKVKPDPVAALEFARKNGLPEGRTEDWMRLLREAEDED